MFYYSFAKNILPGSKCTVMDQEKRRGAEKNLEGRRGKVKNIY